MIIRYKYTVCFKFQKVESHRLKKKKKTVGEWPKDEQDIIWWFKWEIGNHFKVVSKLEM
jgi:hypothetical protein